ncbi:SH3 domain-containing protein [Agaribacter flavus]|uniref:SH3 domain-containing protein n=1 Tax=Agaribacter flavus TaxID=1902781 RepID=A0ABV7FMC9_9ALTE
MYRSVALLLVLYFCAFIASADELRVTVTSPYINVHSGPADEFPVFYVLSKGDEIDILKARTGWYKIRSVASPKRQIEGWIFREALTATVLKDGLALKPASGSFDDYLTRHAEFTVMGGVLDNTAALSATGTWVWTKNLAVDANYTQALGDFSDNKLWSVRMRHTVFPAWKISPYLALGTGEIRTKPKANLVQSGDEVRKSNHYELGVGVRYYLSDGVLVKAEYRSVLALTDRDEQARLDQWLVGASVFF